MKFIVIRTSDWGSESIPCQGAELLNPDFKQTDESPVWGIEIDTLEQLMQFCNTYGDIVITASSREVSKYASCVIEIYDDYRE